MSDLLPQPPPSVPPPPPGPEALRSRRKMKWILKLGIGCIALLLFGVLFSPFVFRSKKSGNLIEAISNAKQVGLSLQEFDAEYGRFPDATTAPVVKAKTGTPLSLASGSSNQLFRQLIATVLKTERPFYAKASFTHKPDDDFTDDAHAIAPGECGFAYVSGLTSSDDPAAPLVMAPIIRGTTRFDQKVMDGKAVILRVDNSVTALTIDGAGHVILNGMDLFDPRQPFWNGKVPDLRWPE